MNSNKKKVIFFLQSGVGGAERMTILIGKFLDRRKYDVKFFPVENSVIVSDITKLIPDGYKYDCLPKVSPIKRILQFYSILKREKPDIVFSSVLYINNKLLLLKLLFPNIRFIVRCENYLYTFNKKQRLVVKFCYRLADSIIAQTKEMKDELVEIGINESKIFALQNPIDQVAIEKFIKDAVSPYLNNGKKHFIASGRFVYQKGFDLLIEAFSEVVLQRDDVDLYIIGSKEGEYEVFFDKVWSIVESKELQGKVHCLGFQDNPYVYVKYADCFVLSSRWEGLPNVLIEALYLGIPAAAMKCIPVVERIVSEGVDGYLAEKDDSHSLAVAMSKAIELGHIQSNYKGTQSEDFVRLFE